MDNSITILAIAYTLQLAYALHIYTNDGFIGQQK